MVVVVALVVACLGKASAETIKKPSGEASLFFFSCFVSFSFFDVF